MFGKRGASGSPEGGSKKPPKKPHQDQGSGPGPGAASSSVEENAADLNVSGEELPNEVVENIANNQNGATYAGAASRPVINYKYLVYIQKGRLRREPITKALFLAFMTKLQSKLWVLPKEEFEKVNIDWSDHHLGRGLVACMDQETAAFVKAEAETFEHESSTVRAWLKDEFGVHTMYQAFLHNEIWWDQRGPAALAWIMKKNGLIERGKFQVITYQKHRKGVFLRFEADDELAAAIDDHGLVLRAGICRVVLKKKVITPKAADEACDN